MIRRKFETDTRFLLDTAEHRLTVSATMVYTATCASSAPDRPVITMT